MARYSGSSKGPPREDPPRKTTPSTSTPKQSPFKGHTYRHASAAGASVIEFESDGKAAAEIAALHMWTIAHVNMSTTAQEGV